MTIRQSDLRGITTPVVTPFDGMGIDWTAYETLLSQLGEAAVDTVFVCGTTGKFASLTHDERRRVVEQAVQIVPDAMSVIAGGTGTNRNNTLDWIETMADLGVNAAVVTAPYFHTSNGPNGLQRFFERVADQSPLPVLLYNLPACVGEEIPVEVVADLATHDSIIGLKDSSGDLAYGLRTNAHV